MNHLTNSHAFKGASDPYDGPPIESLIAAILDEKYTLSTEELAVFEELIDDPDVDPAERKKLLLIIWNTVACFSDYFWDVARFARHENACGSNEKSDDLSTIEACDMVELEHQNYTNDYNKAASDAAGRKGSP